MAAPRHVPPPMPEESVILVTEPSTDVNGLIQVGRKIAGVRRSFAFRCSIESNDAVMVGAPGVPSHFVTIWKVVLTQGQLDDLVASIRPMVHLRLLVDLPVPLS